MRYKKRVPRINDLFGEDEKHMRLLYRADLRRRWRYGSAGFFSYAETVGLVVSRYVGRRPLYSWRDVWNFECRQSRSDRNIACRENLMTQTELAAMSGLRRSAIMRMISSDEIPNLRIGTAIRFVRSEIQQWLKSRKSE